MNIFEELEHLRQRDASESLRSQTARHTPNPNAKPYKGRMESREHRLERRGRKWHGDDHGAYKKCMIGPHYGKWGNDHPFNVCPEHIDVVLQYGEMVVAGLIALAQSGG